MANIRNSMVEVLSESEIVNYVKAALKKMNAPVNVVSIIEVRGVLDKEWGVTASDLEIRTALSSLGLEARISMRNRVVQLAHSSESCHSVQSIISDEKQFSGRDLVMTGISLRSGDCESCSWLFNQIHTELKRRDLTWNSY